MDDDNQNITRKRLGDSLLTVMAIGTLLFFGSTLSSVTARSLVLAELDQKGISDNSTITAIIASNGQILSRALLLDPPLLANVKQALKSNTESILQNSLKQLLLQANSFLMIRPTSVIEKTELPSSGDKHDFLSLAPYRWPDPDKPNGLPYRGRGDGKVNPEIYSIPDKKNMDDMIYKVKILSLAYYLTDNPQYASKAEELLRVWFLNTNTHMNPNLQHAEVHRGTNGGSTAGIIAGKNLPDITDSIGLIQQSPSWSKQDQQGIELWFSKYLNWLLNSINGKEESRKINNHRTWYDRQVSSIALFLNKKDIANSTLQAVIKHKLIEEEIQPNGRQPIELRRANSLDYSIFNLLGLFKLASVGQHLGIDLWNYKTPKGAGLQKALDYLLPYLTKKQTWPYSQIEPINAKNLVDLLCLAAIYYPNNQSYIQSCTSASAQHINIAQINIAHTFPP